MPLFAIKLIFDLYMLVTAIIFINRSILTL